MNRIMHQLSRLKPDEIEWIDQLIGAALRRPNRS